LKKLFRGPHNIFGREENDLRPLYFYKKEEKFLLIQITPSLMEEVLFDVSHTHQINKRVTVEDPWDADT